MSAIAFDRKPLAVYMVQRITRSRPPVTITAPAPEVLCATYDVVSDTNRDAYLRQSAATRDGKVAEFQRV